MPKGFGLIQKSNIFMHRQNEAENGSPTASGTENKYRLFNLSELRQALFQRKVHRHQRIDPLTFGS